MKFYRQFSIRLMRLKNAIKAGIFIIFFLCTLALPFISLAQLDRNKLSVAFEEFDRIDAKRYDNSIQIDVADLIKIGLLKVDYLSIIDPIDNENNRDIKEQYYQTDNVKTVEDPDILIYGTYAIYEKTYSINASIFITSDKKTIDIPPISGELANPYMQLEQLSQSIIDAISVWYYQSPGQKKIAILCKAKKVRREDKINLDYYRNLTIQITEGIDRKPLIMLTPWDRAAKYYLSDMENEEIAEQLSVDALLIANIEMLEDGVSKINPTFFIKNSNDFMELGEIQSDYFNDVPLKDELVFRTNKFFDHILKKDGSWNIDLFMESANNFDQSFEIAHKYYENSMPSISNYYYFKAQKFNPQSVDVHYNMAINYALMERYAESQQEYERTLSLNKNYMNAYLGLYYLHIHKADYNSALAVSKAAESVKPDDPVTLSIMGNSLYYTGDYEQAISYLQRAIEHTPDDHSLYSSLGLSQYALSQLDEAIESFKKAQGLDPENQNYRFYVAEMMIKKASDLMLDEKFDEALQNLLESREYYDLDYAADYIRQCYLFMGQLDEAIDIFSEYLNRGYYAEKTDYFKFSTDIRNAFLKSGSISYLLPEYGEAVLSYTNKHLLIVPDDAFALWQIGNTYTFLENYEKGLEYLEKAYYADKTNMDFALDLTESLLLNLRYVRSDEIIQEILQEKKRMNPIPESDKMLLKLLHVGNIAALNDRIDRNDEKDIYQYLKEGKQFKDWSYDAFIDWINIHLSENTKPELLALVSEMEKNTQ